MTLFHWSFPQIIDSFGVLLTLAGFANMVFQNTSDAWKFFSAHVRLLCIVSLPFPFLGNDTVSLKLSWNYWQFWCFVDSGWVCKQGFPKYTRRMKHFFAHVRLLCIVSLPCPFLGNDTVSLKLSSNYWQFWCFVDSGWVCKHGVSKYTRRMNFFFVHVVYCFISFPFLGKCRFDGFSQIIDSFGVLYWQFWRLFSNYWLTVWCVFKGFMVNGCLVASYWLAISMVGSFNFRVFLRVLVNLGFRF